MASEIAQLREALDLEEQSLQNTFSFAALASHAATMARMQQGAEALVKLFEAGKDADAYLLWNSGIMEGGYT